MDNLTPEQRRKNMQHIKSQNTKIEVLLRKALWKKGYRYKKNCKDLPGKTEKRNHYLRTLMKCRKGTPLTAEVMYALIERIDVYPDKRVVIHFAYSGKEVNGLEGGVRL